MIIMRYWNIWEVNIHMVTSFRVSVHVATCDRPTELSILLNSLRNQTFKDWDLIIVDEGSQSINNFKYVTDILNRIKLDKHAIKYVKNDVKKGISHARNLCIKNDEWNDVFIRIDDDSIPNLDYIERLVSVYLNNKNCAVGGLVPPFNSPEFYRDCTGMKVFNKIKFFEDHVEITDDGGYVWLPEKVIPSDHLRSSFLFPREAGLHTENIGGNIGWREETVFTMNMKWNGIKLLTDTGAICFHSHGRSGGARLPPQEYEDVRRRNEEWFQKWAMRNYKKRGWE